MEKPFQKIVLSCAWAWLVGCNSTVPKVNEAAAPGTVACSVGEAASARVIRVEVWRGREEGLSAYGTARVCEQLQEVSRQLLSQGVSLRFDVMGAVQTHTGLGRANNGTMQAITATEGQLKLVIVDAIAQCGDAVGYILGCTPQLGRPLVYAKRHDPFNDLAPEWVIWAHEMGHAVGLYHPDAPGMTTVPERIMTYMPMPQSRVLVNHETVNFAQLGSVVSLPHAALGQPPGLALRIAPEQLLPLVRGAGPHGLPLGQLTHLGDAALLSLGVLLDDADSTGGTSSGVSSLQPGLPVRINALVLMAELGGDGAQAHVRQYLTRQSGPDNLDIRLYGLSALGRGQRRHPTEASLSFLKQATEARFWCADVRRTTSECAALADAARDALREAESRP